MAVPFSRSTRSLSADNHRFALLGLASAMVLVTAWCGWFFFARITLHEISQDARLDNAELIVAVYPKSVLGRIVRGQTARFQPDGLALKTAIPAVVSEVTRTDGDVGHVTLILIHERGLPRSLEPNATGQLSIEVGQISPARLVLQAAGLGEAGAPTPGAPALR